MCGHFEEGNRGAFERILPAEQTFWPSWLYVSGYMLLLLFVWNTLTVS